jgi:mRNA interferase RelE/StbE
LKSAFRASFRRDVKRIRSERILAGVRQAILDVEAAAQWSDVAANKKIRGAFNAFRIRVDDYRIGLFIEGDLAEFVRVLPRRDIYRKFP